jgi:hypothetical protein
VGIVHLYGPDVSQITGTVEADAVNQEATERAITEWLARAHPTPDQAHEEWAHGGVALLPLGHRFAAVRLTSQLVETALATIDPATIAEQLEERLDGPVIHDTRSAGQPYYALIEWHAGLVWDDTVAPCLSSAWHMGVPHISRVKPPGTYWLVSPRREGDLCRPEAVRKLVDDARTATADELAEVTL